MKKLFYLVIALFAALSLSSCGNEGGLLQGLKNILDPGSKTVAAEVDSSVSEYTPECTPEQYAEAMIAGEESAEEEMDFVGDYAEYMNFVGTVAGANVHMSLKKVGGEVSGRYRYDSQYAKGNTASMRLFGLDDSSIKPNEGTALILTEFINDKNTGIFDGIIDGDEFCGTFTRLKDGKEFDFSLLLASEGDGFFENDELDFDVPYFVTENIGAEPAEPVGSADSAVSSSNGVDMDEILDEYEKLIGKYISFAKKVQSGDLNAMTEYASYMEQAFELQEKLEDMEGDMTPAQMSRLTRLIEKMAGDAANF